MAETKILAQQCLAALHAILEPLAIQVTPRRRRLPRGVDAICEFGLPDRQTLRLCALVRRGLRPATLPQLQDQIDTVATERVCDRVIVLTDYVAATLAETLREQRINFIDAAGNAHLTVPGHISVFHTGNRPPRRAPMRGQDFTESGARILFFLLQHGPRIHATYRDMQTAVGVSLDKISKVMNELAADRVLVAHTRGDYEITDPATLLDRWAAAFAAKLEAKLRLGTFKAPTGDDFAALTDTIATAKIPAVIGGEVAAGWLTDYLRPGAIRLYIPEEAQAVVQRKLRLAPAHDGNIELCRTFAADLGQHLDSREVLVAHPLIVYGELMAGNDVRLGETALRLKEQHLPWIT